MKSNQLNVLILGYGSREHALGWKIAQSPRVSHLFFAPGNAGTAEIGTNVPISDEDVEGLVRFALETQIDLTVVGTNDPLALGVVDAFQAVGLAIFGPNQQAARLESSKAFAKGFMSRHSIPTPRYQTFTAYDEAVAFIDEQENGRLVVKISGLGKMGMGVTVCDTKDEAKIALHDYMIKQTLGESGQTVIIEERMNGPELSIFGLSDGKTVVPLTPVRDHKRIFDNDMGPNTGGMGAFGPPEDLPSHFLQYVTETILQPTINGMAAEGHPYVGVLFVGLMQTALGLQVLEYNCRFGNPEALVLMSLLESDLVDVMTACLEGTLSSDQVKIGLGAATAIVASSPQYPAEVFPLGLAISGIEADISLPHVELFHHGTAVKNNQLVTARGRVFAVTAVGATLQHSLEQAYAAIEKIHFEGMHYRKDIGQSIPLASQNVAVVKEMMEYERPFSFNRLY
ncbi:MAG: phosphoribosylamine--glycine ligase [Chloroflexota bacterium]